MTNIERRTIGLDRLIHIEWLDATAGRLAAGDSPEDARKFVWELLEGVVAGKTAQSARGKTLTVLARVWLRPPGEASDLRDRVLRVIGSCSADERLALHWALFAAAYPFFVDVAGAVGKVLSLHGEIALSQLTRRIVEVWGDRSTLRPAVQRLMRSMIQWGALRDGPKPGIYLAPSKKIVATGSVAELLIEGFLVTAQAGLPLSQLVSYPAAFPFEIRPDLAALRRSERLRVHRQGDQTDIVERLKSQTVVRPPAVTPKKQELLATSAGPKKRTNPKGRGSEVSTPARKTRTRAKQPDPSRQLTMLR